MINVTEGALAEFQSSNPEWMNNKKNSEHFSKEVLSLPTDKVNAKEQVRKSFNNIDELTASIQENGQLQPIVVDPENSEGIFIIQAGERRYLACKKLGVNVFAIVNNRDESNSDLEVLQTIENIQRDNLTPFEIGEALQKMTDKYGYTQEQIAQKIGKNKTYVNRYLSVNSISEDLLMAAKESGTKDPRLIVSARRIHAIKPKLAIKMLAKNASRKEMDDTLTKLKAGKRPRRENTKHSVKVTLGVNDRACIVVKKIDELNVEVLFSDNKQSQITGNSTVVLLSVQGD